MPNMFDIFESEVWYYIGRHWCHPKHNRIALGPVTQKENSFCAADVFHGMQLDLEKLSQIFVDRPWKYFSIPREERERQPKARFYQDLGYCRSYDDDAWSALARLAGKTIHFVNENSDPRGMIRAIYYPNGEINIIELEAS